MYTHVSLTKEIIVRNTIEPERSIRLLLLDDDETFAGVLTEYLDSLGHSVVTVHDGVDGLKQVMKQTFDVIVCDLKMPKLPGQMFYRAVQAVSPSLSDRFIFITGFELDPQTAVFLQETKALRLFKPFELGLLAEMVLLAMRSMDGGYPSDWF